MDDKSSSTSGATEAPAPASRAHHAGDGGAGAGGTKRFSANRKLAAVQRLFRGESLEAEKWRAVAREGKDPIKEREKERCHRERNMHLLEDVTRDCFETRKAELKGEGKAGRWFSPLGSGPIDFSRAG